MSGITYKIKESAEDAFLTVVEKHGDVVEFTPVDMVNEQRQLDKLIVELGAKLKLEGEKQANIEEHHPFVKDFDLKQLFTLHMYYESLSFCEALPEKIAEFEKQRDESRAELVKIATELGLDILPKAPEIIVEQAMAKIVDESETPTENGDQVS